MSYTSGFQTLVQSMNGLLTFNDGAGTIIQNGTITTKSLSLNNIYASITTSACSLWTNLTGSQVITIGTSSNPLRTPYGATGTTDIVNWITMYNYVSTSISNLLSATNVWSGLSNTFQNSIYCDFYNAITTSGTLQLFNNATSTAIINIAGSTKPTVNIAGLTFTGSTNNVAITPTTTADRLTIFASGVTNVGTLALSGNSITTTIANATMNLYNSYITLNSTYLQPTISIGTTLGTVSGPSGNYTQTITIGNTTTANFIGGLLVSNATLDIQSGATDLTLNLGTSFPTQMNIGTGSNLTNLTIGDSSTTSTRTISVGSFLINRLGNGGSKLANFDTISSQDMTIGYTNANQIWLGTTTTLNANSLITSRAPFQTNDRLKCNSNVVFFPPQTFATQASLNSVGGQFNANLGSTNELDIVSYTGNSATNGGVNFYVNNTNSLNNTTTLLLSSVRGQGTQILTGGFSFDKGNLTRANYPTGYFTQTSRLAIVISAVPSQGAKQSSTINFTTAFSAVPTLNLTLELNSQDPNLGRVIPSIYSISSSGFVANFFNAGGSTTQTNITFYLHYTATGAY